MAATCHFGFYGAVADDTMGLAVQGQHDEEKRETQSKKILDQYRVWNFK